MKARRDRLLWAGIGVGLKILALALRRAGRKDPWLGRALAGFDGVYRFQNGDGSRGHFLFFDGPRVRAGRVAPRPPDFTFTLYHPESLRLRGPEAVLEVVIANQIGQSGNMYYLYRFGFIMSLLERRLRYPRQGEAAYE